MKATLVWRVRRICILHRQFVDTSDLLVHRAIRSDYPQPKPDHGDVTKAKAILRKNIYPYDEAQMVTAGLHTSMAERRADEATRDVMAWLKCEY